MLGQTTILFRTGVVIAILVLGGLLYQQARLNALLEQRLEISQSRLENFAAALARARREALTPGDLQELRGELAGRLSSTAERLQALERRSSAGERVIAASVPSIVFLQGAYGFRETSSGRMLRQVVDDAGQPIVSPLGQPLLSLDGDGPVAERQFTGSGFAVGDGGTLITNRHVALPWEADTADVQALAAQGLEAVMIRFIAYPPASPKAGRVKLVRASKSADLAILHATDMPTPLPGLRLADRAPRPGDEVLVMGYPTGLRSMLAQSGDAFIAELQKSKDIDFWSVARRLAEGRHIAPLASRGIVGQVTPATVVYDAETTRGGSGGPVLDVDGAVIAVNTAVLPEFGGSNLGVPVAQVRALLAEAGLR
jgi:S1-C subfamily serine protease